jgi:hypothetical protein
MGCEPPAERSIILQQEYLASGWELGVDRHIAGNASEAGVCFNIIRVSAGLSARAAMVGGNQWQRYESFRLVARNHPGQDARRTNFRSSILVSSLEQFVRGSGGVA